MHSINMKKSALLVVMLLHTTFGLYVNVLDQRMASYNTVKIQKHQEIVLPNNVKAQKTEYETNGFIQKIPYVKSNAQKSLSDKYVKLYLRLLKKIKKSEHVPTENLISNLQRRRRKIETKMPLDLSPENDNGFLKMFYNQHGTTQFGYNSNTEDDDDDYRETDVQKNYTVSPDYSYENLYDDEEDTSLSAKSHKNLEYGSFQDLILQAKYNQLGQKNEEIKLQSPESFG